MFTEIEIKSTTNRVYIEYYFDGIRQREYNANKLEIQIFPNKAKNQADKNRLLKRLKYEFEKALEKGWNPLLYEVEKESKETGLEDSLKQTLASNLSGHYSRTCKRDLEWICDKFLNFLTSSEKNSPIRVDQGITTFTAFESPMLIPLFQMQRQLFVKHIMQPHLRCSLLRPWSPLAVSASNIIVDK